jgi:hypothetical protein
MRLRRLFTIGPEAEAKPVQLLVQPLGAGWAAMILGPEDRLPGPGELGGVSFLADTAEEAEEVALDYLHGLGRLN